MSTFGKIMRKRLTAWDHAAAKAYAVGAILGGVEVAPGPEKSKGPTGRSRASLAIGAGDPATYDPGPAVAHIIPTAATAHHGLSARHEGQSVFVDMGVPYREYVESKYHVVETAHRAGVAALLADPAVGDTLSG